MFLKTSKLSNVTLHITKFALLFENVLYTQIICIVMQFRNA